MKVSLRAFLTALLSAALACAAHAQTQVSVDITDVTVEQLTNGLRLTVKADGLLEVRTAEGWWETNEEHEFTLFLRNARSSVGTFVDVSRYPVNYLRLETPQESREGVGLMITTRLYRQGHVRTVDIDNATWSWRWDWRPGDVAYDLRKSSSGRDLIITVWSDRRELLPDDRVPRAKQNLAEHLTLEIHEGRLTVDAVNVPLQRLMSELAAVTGQSIYVSDRIERLGTVRLEAVEMDGFVGTLCTAVGLTARFHDGAWYISDGLPSSLAPYTAGGSRIIKLSHLRAEAAISLLPEFLLRYLRPSASGDAVVAHGPVVLLNRIEADLLDLDRPPRAVRMTTAMVEASGTRARQALWSLILGGPTEVELDATGGALHISRIEEPKDDLLVRLRALETTEQLSVAVRPSLVVEEGQHAQIFAGVRQFFQFLRRGEVLDLDSTEAGVRLSVRPGALGDDVVQAFVALDVSTIRGTRRPPVVDRREASATLLLASGESMVIGGGLTDSSELGERTGPLPTLRADEKSMREIVFIIGAEIVNGAGTQIVTEPVQRREN